MSTNKTPNLKLHSWLPLDPFSREEINDNFTALDNAHAALDGRVTGLQTTIASIPTSDALAAETAERKAAVSAEATTRANADSALRTDLTTAQNNIKSLQTAITKCGNCKIVYGTYTGAGADQKITFDGDPKLVIVRRVGGSGAYLLVALSGVTSSYTTLNTTASATLTWGTKSLTIGKSEFTTNSINYCYIALIATD